MDFELASNITEVQTIALGRGIRELTRLWYDAHGIGKKEFKRKRYLD